MEYTLKKTLFFFNSKILYTVENLEKAGYIIQKIPLRILLNTRTIQQLVFLAP